MEEWRIKFRKYISLNSPAFYKFVFFAYRIMTKNNQNLFRPKHLDKFDCVTQQYIRKENQRARYVKIFGEEANNNI